MQYEIKFNLIFQLVYRSFIIHSGKCSKYYFSENLAANSEPLKVKMGTQGFGKIAKWKFGEYAVVASKAGWVKTTSKSNFFNTKTQSKTTQ